MWEYTDKVRKHYLHPSNVGEVENPDGIGEVGNIKCGDALRLTFKLTNDGKIQEIKFKTFGCGSAIASSSVLTEMCKGKTLDEVAKISNNDIADALGGLPREKMHCSVMGQEALQKAIEFYKTGGEIKTDEHDHGHVICTCFNITEEEIKRVIVQNNLKSVSDITNFTKAGGGCGGCIGQLETILEQVTEHTKNSDSRQKIPKKMTLLQKIDAIRTVLDTHIRPQLQKDGGDCEFIDLEGNTVYIDFQGHCKRCEFSQMTQYSFIEKVLKEKVDERLCVKEAEHSDSNE